MKLKLCGSRRSGMPWIWKNWWFRSTHQLFLSLTPLMLIIYTSTGTQRSFSSVTFFLLTHFPSPSIIFPFTPQSQPIHMQQVHFLSPISRAKVPCQVNILGINPRRGVFFDYKHWESGIRKKLQIPLESLKNSSRSSDYCISMIKCREVYPESRRSAAGPQLW